MITTLVGAAEPPRRPVTAAWTTSTSTTTTMAVSWPAATAAAELARPPYRTTAHVGRALPEIEAP